MVKESREIWNWNFHLELEGGSGVLLCSLRQRDGSALESQPWWDLPSCSGCSQCLWLWWDNPGGGIRNWCKV